MIDWFNGPMVSITLAVFAFLFVANEIGFRFGRAFDKDEPEPSRAVANAIKASVIGLVAFLLGFAFSISVGRHEVRRRVVLDEANAAGTLYLRAGLLPEVERDRLRQALTVYLDLRLRFFETDPLDKPKQAQLARDLGKQLDEVWGSVESAKGRDPQSTLVSQVVPAANEVIDLNTSRDWAFRGDTPLEVLIVLLVCVLISAGLIGHSFGQYQRRHGLLCLAFNLLFAMTLYLILDFDGPRRGMIQVDHLPLIELRNKLQPVVR